MTNKPYSVNDVVDGVLLKLNADEDCFVVNLKLQKLVYYIQAWYYGKNKVPFMTGDFEAWVHGPVHRELYNRFKDTKSLYSLIGQEDILNRNALANISEEDSDFMDMILENYACYSATELEKLTHQERPWIEARRNLGPLERCTAVINPETMKTYYGEKWNQINGQES